MEKNVIKIAFFVLLVSMCACNSTQQSTTAENPNLDIQAVKISTSNLKTDLDYLASNDLKGRKTGSEGIEKAATYIEKELKQTRVKPFFKTYRDSFNTNGITGYNLVGVLEGNDPKFKNEYIVVSAHYDHIGILKAVAGDSIANGADDNAAGTVSVLELARQFSKIHNNKRSIIFAFFSGEELGLKGSTHLAGKLKQQGIHLYTILNLEMIGVPMVGKDYLAYVTGFETSNLAQKFNEYSNEKVLGFLPTAKKYNLFKRSDNYSFYEQFHVPSQTISSFDFTNYPYYHKVKDGAENMDYDFITKLVTAMIPGIYKMANTEEEEIKLN